MEGCHNSSARLSAEIFKHTAKCMNRRYSLRITRCLKKAGPGCNSQAGQCLFIVTMVTAPIA